MEQTSSGQCSSIKMLVLIFLFGDTFQIQIFSCYIVEYKVKMNVLFEMAYAA